MMLKSIGLCVLVGGALGMSGCASLDPVILEVRAGARSYRGVPVSVAVPETVPEGAVSLAWDGGSALGQVMVEPAGRRLYWISDLDPGESLSMRLRPTAAVPDGIGVRCDIGDGDVRVTVDGEHFTTHLAVSGHKPVWYPLLSSSGVPVTRGFPIEKREGDSGDHPHHRSFWFTHGAVNGVDFWSEASGAGRIVQRAIETESGPVVGVIRTANDWVRPDGTRVCADTRVMRVYRVPEGRLFDVEITVTATDGAVTFGDTKEGSFGFRTTDSMKPDAGLGGLVLNARGERDGATWGRRAEWLDTSGPVDGRMVGIAILEHPTSFRAPTYWHSRTYGLVAANPFGLHDFLRDRDQDGSHTLAPGESMRFRFRVWIHEGTAEEAGVAGQWEQYAYPPQITLN